MLEGENTGVEKKLHPSSCDWVGHEGGAVTGNEDLWWRGQEARLSYRHSREGWAVSTS